LPHIRWASHSRMASGAVEVSLADGRSEWFDNGNQALDWVFGNGFVPAEMAIAPRLVQRAPAPPYGPSAEHAADACFQRRGGTNVPEMYWPNRLRVAAITCLQALLLACSSSSKGSG